MRSIAIKIVESGWLPNKELLDSAGGELAQEVGQYIKELGSRFNGHFEANAQKFISRLPLHLQGFCWEIAGSKDPPPAVKPEDIEVLTPKQESKKRRRKKQEWKRFDDEN